MSKIEIPIISVESGGPLFGFYYNNCTLRSDVVKVTSDVLATASDNFDLSMAEIDAILDESGEVYEQLMAIRVTNMRFRDSPVPDTLPNWNKFNGVGDEVHKSFSEWLVPGAEWWMKDDKSEFIMYTNPFAGNADKYLTGSEIKIIEQINPIFVSVIKTSEVAAIVATGWTKM